jgi:hypothetical protein
MAEIGFKGRARRHQISFRENILRVGHGDHKTFLTEEDAIRGFIFFNGLGIFEAAQKRLPPHEKQNKACYANMLRSEHIPFNFFIPLANDLGFAQRMLSVMLGNFITRVKSIIIEHAPDPKEALSDRTSFDVYVEYTHADGSDGILGIEVKYTEKEYRLTLGSKEEKDINNPDSPYFKVTSKVGIYRDGVIEKLKSDEFRQIWRNQLLGESMTNLNNPRSSIIHFTSIILYPSGNEHFKKVIPAYMDLLKPSLEDKFLGITYEEFIKAGRLLTDDPEYWRWLQYLDDRYLVK